jgi:hypothetical protein
MLSSFHGKIIISKQKENIRKCFFLVKKEFFMAVFV